MAKQANFSGAIEGVRSCWRNARTFALRFDDLYVDEWPSKDIKQLIEATEKKIDSLERLLDDLNTIMVDIRYDLRGHLSGLQLPFTVGIVTDNKYTRAQQILWRHAGQRGTWITMGDWLEVLAAANLSTATRQWYADVTKIFYVLNMQSAAAHGLRLSLVKNLTQLTALDEKCSNGWDLSIQGNKEETNGKD